MVTHQKYNWNMLYFGGNSNLLDEYRVFTIPHYLLIDANGNLVSASALPPAPDGEGNSIERTFFDLKKKAGKKGGFKIGEK